MTLRWYTPAPNPDNTTAPAVQTRVQGIIVLVTTFQIFDCPQPFLINTVYSEFNSGSWLYDLGVFKPNCTSSSSKVRRQLMGKRRMKAWAGCLATRGAKLSAETHDEPIQTLKLPEDYSLLCAVRRSMYAQVRLRAEERIGTLSRTVDSKLIYLEHSNSPTYTNATYS